MTFVCIGRYIQFNSNKLNILDYILIVRFVFKLILATYNTFDFRNGL